MCCQLCGVHWHTLKFGVCYSLNLRPLHSYMLFPTDRPASSIRASSFVGSRIFGEQCGRIRLSQEQLVLQGYSHRSYEISLVEVGICLTNIYRKELMTFASSLPRGSYLHFHLKRRVGKRHFTRWARRSSTTAVASTGSCSTCQTYTSTHWAPSPAPLSTTCA